MGFLGTAALAVSYYSGLWHLSILPCHASPEVPGALEIPGLGTHGCALGWLFVYQQLCGNGLAVVFERYRDASFPAAAFPKRHPSWLRAFESDAPWRSGRRGSQFPHLRHDRDQRRQGRGLHGNVDLWLGGGFCWRLGASRGVSAARIKDLTSTSPLRTSFLRNSGP